MDLAKIPPRKETAAKFARYFLCRLTTSIVTHPHMRVIRNAIDTSKKESPRYDIILIIDSSDSVKRINFHRSLKALKKIVKRGIPETKYAAISSNHAKLEFVFLDKGNALEKINHIKYRPGKTNTQEALHLALTEMVIQSNASNVRAGSVRRILLVTDGLSSVKSNLTLECGWELKNSGVEIFVIAVGQYDQGLEEIVGLASSTTAHLYRVKNMVGFLQVIKLIPVRTIIEKSWLSNMNQGRIQV